MRKTLSQQHRGKKMIGTIALQCVRKNFQLEKKAENVIREREILEGYVKKEKLFLKTSDQALKIEIFKRKKELIATVNEQLETLGYRQRIDEVFLK
ncbi:MAG: hypothetical protein LBG59_06670 [Candidatus Peribacteria bacterium]|nr:hypothetical protein [Candidatus Peribacteria bacterium]